MIPWASPSLLASNPAFAQLHQRLVTDLLDHDGTTIVRHSPQQGRDQKRSTESSSPPSTPTISDRLTAHRVSLARRQLLASALFDLALADDDDISNSNSNPNGGDDSQEGVDVLAMQQAALTIATYLYRYRHVSPQQQHQHLNHQPELLQLLLSDVSTLRRHKGKLISTQLKRLEKLRMQTLPRARYNATNATVEVLRAQAVEAEWLVRWLEQRRHGAEARYVAARARWLAAVARGMAAKARVRRRMAQLDEEEEELDRHKGELSEALAEYETQGISIAIMEQLGQRYAEIESEIDQVKADLDRLRLSRSSPQWV
ncbi:hypothetical protein DV735_g5936, partial [Chaetothyriales sp. CBS 134920]